MLEVELGPLALVVEHRHADGDGGPALRVRERGEAGREWLRFDCFERSPHWHLDPDGPDRLTRFDPRDDPVESALALARGLPDLVARAGRPGALELDAGALDAALVRVESALRNPPVDLDAVDLGTLRRRRGEKWRHFGSEPLAAWVADMDFPVAEPIRLTLQRALDLGDLGYPVNPRPTDLPTVFAERALRRFGWQVSPRQVEVITDVVQGIFTALSVWTEPGDGVLVQTPVYPPFLGSVREMGRRLVTCDLVQSDRGYAIDFDALRRAADRGVRMLLLCHPHNPTGRVFSRAELEGIAALALERDLVVVSDEIHADLVYAGRVHVPFASLGAEVERRTVTLTSATKAFNIAGLRCAVAVYGSEELKRRFRTVPRHLRGGVNTLGLAATEAAWRHADPWLAGVLAYLDANRQRVAEVVRERLPGIGHALPEATYLAWLDCRALELAPDPQRFFLERAGVALSDGAPFGEAGKGFVRLNFATSRAILDEILERMAKALAEAR
jgi:cystathionine beta-lyase